jgi:hypothetical protein
VQERRSLNAALASPVTVTKDASACLAVVSAFDGLTRAQQESIFRSQSPGRWLEDLEVDRAGGEGQAGPAGSSSDADTADTADTAGACRALLAQRLLLAAREGRSRALEESLLLPWLRAKGPAKATDEWLEWAWRAASREGPRSSVAKEAFKRLFAEADNETVKETARLWLEKNAAGGQTP